MEDEEADIFQHTQTQKPDNKKEKAPEVGDDILVIGKFGKSRWVVAIWWSNTIVNLIVLDRRIVDGFEVNAFKMDLITSRAQRDYYILDVRRNQRMSF